MPTISVEKERFFRDLGRNFGSDKEFEEILFDYGLELDEDTSLTAPDEKPHRLKIEVPANRYDLLCHQGLVQSLNTYTTSQSHPTFRVIVPDQDQIWSVHVTEETKRIRPFFGSAILRGISFDEKLYADFIDLQDKLHGNLCRRRSLVAIGTHDLDRIDSSRRSISYEARPPQDIRFAPLNKQVEYDANQLMSLYESDKHLSKYLHIIRDSPVYPIIYDNSRTVLSMPPIINSNHTKITLETKNVFIDVTATDKTKLDIVVNMIVTMFSKYCSQPFSVEAVNIIYEHDLASSYLSPKLDPQLFEIRQSYINSITGLNLTRQESIDLLRKMGHQASIHHYPQTSSDKDLKDGTVALNSITSKKISTAPITDLLRVLVPATRPDILHECDLVEDVAIGYGFNNLRRSVPDCGTVGKAYPLNKLSDLVRKECAYAGWLEVLPLTLCSHDENFKFLRKSDDKTTAVVLSNPATIEFQVVRTSLIPGLMKTVRENRKHQLPIKIFEVSDVVLKDDRLERRARNVRRVGAIYVGKRGAGFEVVHGLLDRIMAMMEIDWSTKNEKNNGFVDGIDGTKRNKRSASSRGSYKILESNNPTYFPGRSARIMFRPSTNNTTGKADNIDEEAGWREIGSLGILHPDVLEFFEIDYPCSGLEFDLIDFL